MQFRGVCIFLPELVLSCQLEPTIWCIFGAKKLSKIAKYIQNKGLISVGHHVANVTVVSSTLIGHATYGKGWASTDVTKYGRQAIFNRALIF